jgi:molecular chaperone GrpE (heat shock protein)
MKKLKMTVNNYIESIIKRQLNSLVLEDKKIDPHHHEVIFKVNSNYDIQLIQKVTTYKGEIITD